MLDRQQTIEQIKANIAYYEQFADPCTVGSEPSVVAAGSVEALKELLFQIEEYEDVFDFRKQVFTDEELTRWDKK